MYTLERAAEILGRSERTVKRWMKRCGVEGTKMEIDRRLYLSDSDMVTLAAWLDRKTAKIASKKMRKQAYNSEVIAKGEANNSQENAEEKIYSLVDAALFLGVTSHTIRRWIVQHGIDKKIINTNRKRIYLSYNDILMLADLHECKVASDIYPVNIVEDLKEIRSMLKDHASDIEDIKHDLRIYSKGFIYLK